MVVMMATPCRRNDMVEMSVVMVVVLVVVVLVLVLVMVVALVVVLVAVVVVVVLVAVVVVVVMCGEEDMCVSVWWEKCVCGRVLGKGARW